MANLRQLQAALTAAQTETASLKQQLAACQASLADLTQQLDAQRLKTAALQEQLTEALARITQLEDERADLLEEIERLKPVIIVPDQPMSERVAQSITPQSVSIAEDDSGPIATITFVEPNPPVVTNPVLGGANGSLFTVAMVNDLDAELSLTDPSAPGTLELTITGTTVVNGAPTPSLPFPITVSVTEVTGGEVDPEASAVQRYTNKGGSTATNFPQMFMRSFADGEIPDKPMALLDGVPIPTQAEVYHRFPSGAAKIARVICIIPELLVDVERRITFANDSNAYGATPSFPTIAETVSWKITHTDLVQTDTKTLAAMQAAGHFDEKFAGPIATCRWFWDKSTSRVYDMPSWDAVKPFRPIFEIIHFHPINRSFVRAIGSLGNSKALKAQWATGGITCTIGSDIYTQAYTATPYTIITRTGWLGGTPSEQINIDFDVEDYGEKGTLPNYYVSKMRSIISESHIAAVTPISSSVIGFNRKGGWTGTQLSGSWEVQMDPGYAAQALITGDWRFLKHLRIRTDHAGHWPTFMYEGDGAVFFDQAQSVSALGRAMSMYARPAEILFDNGVSSNQLDPYPSANPSGATFTYGGDGPAHQPSPYFIPWLIWAEPFYEWAQQQWAGCNAMRQGRSTDPTQNYFRTHSPNLVMGFEHQRRGYAGGWLCVLRAWLMSKAGTPESAYFNNVVRDHFSVFMGYENLATSAEWMASNAYQWGLTRRAATNAGINQSVLGWPKGTSNSPPYASSDIAKGTTTVVEQQRQVAYMVCTESVGLSFGFPIQALFNRHKTVSDSIMSEILATNYPPGVMNLYSVPVRAGGVLFTNMGNAINELATVELNLRVSRFATGTNDYATSLGYACACIYARSDPKWQLVETHLIANNSQHKHFRSDEVGALQVPSA